MNHKVNCFTVKVTRSTNYNSICIEMSYDYTGNSPRGFTPKEIDILINNTQETADKALEQLKRRVAIPASTRHINK